MPNIIHSVKLQEQLDKAPDLPGCYIYRDKSGTVLYVGKAINLKRRVKSYFQRFDYQIVRIRNMIKQIDSIEYVVADNDLEAFILETNLIRKYKPKYNVSKKDDKNYSWIMIDPSLDFPKIELVRKRTVKKAFYIGPYAAQYPLKHILETLRKIFPYRTCNRVITEKNGRISSSNSKPCLYWYLGLCNAPCAGYLTKKDYRQNVTHIKNFLVNKKEKVLDGLKTNMINLAAQRKFEAAAKIRDKISDLVYLGTKVEIEESTDEMNFRKLKAEGQNRALKELIEALPELKIKFKKNLKIECYDISNIQGAYAVGSMVVFVDGKPAKDLYRKFRIKTNNTPDDFLMHREVQQRRFKKYLDKSEDKSFKTLPDLIIIDGGKGQLSSAYQTQKELDVNVPVIGLAKRFEDIFIVDDQNGRIDFVKRSLHRQSQARYLIQRIRDEAHRFAITYHRQVRSREESLSTLDKVPGVGNVIKIKLLKAFGDVEKITKASDEELLNVIKNKTTVAKIRELLP